MAGKKERYEILFEHIDQKMDLVLEGYNEMGNKFDEARKERELIREQLTHKIEFVAGDLNRKIEETRDDLKGVKEDVEKIKVELGETRDELRGELRETREELRETREELGERIDKVGEKFEDHEIRIEKLEKKAVI